MLFRSYKYDDDGNQTEYARYDKNRNLEYRYVYTLDEEGNCTFTTRYEADGTEEKWRTGKYSYDKYGVALETTEYDSDGNITDEREISQDYNKMTYTSYSYSTNDSGERYLSATYTYTQSGLVASYHPKEDK